MNYKIVTLALILIVMSFTACSQKAIVEEEIISTGKNIVQVEKVKIKDIEEVVTYSGTLEAEKAALVGPELSMKINKILVQEGDNVHKGQVLAIMDSTQLRQAEAQFEVAKKNYERMKSLKNTGSVDKQTFDQIESAYKTAESAYNFIKNNTQIKAPFDGIVTLRTKHEGESFSPMLPSAYGDPALFRIVTLDKLKMNVNISDVDINKIKKGQKAYIFVDSEPDQYFLGTVTFISPEADMMSGTFPCAINIDNRDHSLKPNQFALTDIVIKSSSKTLIIPKDALVDDNYVFVVSKSKASKQAITRGLSNETEVEILSGLSENDLVIIGGAIGLPDGSEVIIGNQ